MTNHLRRRQFITLLGGAAAAWPIAARAQQGGPVRRIGVLIGGAENDPAYQARVAAFQEGLAKLGWIEGQNLRIDLRFGAADLDRIRAYAAELTRLAPEVVVTTSTPATRAVREQGSTSPIVFAAINDPVGSGVVANVARPDGNATGFANFESSMGGKWLELLKEAAPHVVRVALIFDPAYVPETYFASAEAAARALAVQAIKTPIRNSFEIVSAIDAFAAEPNGGLLVFPDLTAITHRATIFQVVAQHRLPAIYALKYFAADGGLISYDSDILDRYRGAASYVDRILRGAKVNELPVQFPTKFQLVINLKAAKAIGLAIPEAFLLRADELIE